MHVGVSTSCLYPLETEKALARLGTLGVRRAEIFLNSPSEAKPAFIRQLRRIADENAMSVTGVHPYCSDTEGMLFFGFYPRRFADGLEEYRRLFEACAVLGAENLIFHGARTGVGVEPALYYERFALLMEEARRFGVTLCQENVARCLSREPDFLAGMAKAIPDVHFVLDVKQAIRSGHSAAEFLSAMGKNLSRIHISDHSAACDCLPPGMGEADFLSLLDKVTRNGFDGDWIIELYRWNFDEEADLGKSFRFLCRTLGCEADAAPVESEFPREKP